MIAADPIVDSICRLNQKKGHLAMKALLKEKPEPGLTLREIDKPAISSPDDVLFKVEYCAICVGESKVYEWNEWAAKTLRYNCPQSWATSRQPR